MLKFNQPIDLTGISIYRKRSRSFLAFHRSEVQGEIAKMFEVRAG
jgi:hypothetical protein